MNIIQAYQIRGAHRHRRSLTPCIPNNTRTVVAFIECNQDSDN